MRWASLQGRPQHWRVKRGYSSFRIDNSEWVMGECVFLCTDFHRTAPYVITGSVDLTVKVWECRWVCHSFVDTAVFIVVCALYCQTWYLSVIVGTCCCTGWLSNVEILLCIQWTSAHWPNTLHRCAAAAVFVIDVCNKSTQKSFDLMISVVFI